jgi:hypothetical protein
MIFEHTVDAKDTQKDFPALYFEYFKAAGPDSISGFIKPVSFLLKIQSEFSVKRIMYRPVLYAGLPGISFLEAESLCPASI